MNYLNDQSFIKTKTIDGFNINFNHYWLLKNCDLHLENFINDLHHLRHVFKIFIVLNDDYFCYSKINPYPLNVLIEII